MATVVLRVDDRSETVAEGDARRSNDALPRHQAALPARIGRYAVVEEVGKGGMGRVLRAYDPKLRREVALKLLRHRDDPEAQARAVREAQAMAQLSHPHLVPVFDVDDDAGEVFIAMEYVEGDTLRTWSSACPRRWTEVVAVFMGAGRGLAAAHAADLVHRDFKPDNVMVGGDGRARVMDFGLARGSGGSDARSSDARFSATSHEVSAYVTEAGTILGTPAYMSPEQHRGDEIGPASDQYAFCVALYESLYRVRPFAGPDARELFRAKQRPVPDAPLGSTVPSWLRNAVLRGLAVDAAQRWPTMDDLLATLERGQSRLRMGRLIAATAILGAGVLGVLGWRVLDERRRIDGCVAEGASIALAWNEDTQAQLRRVLAASGAPNGAVTAEKVEPWLERHARAWQHARTEACLDAQVRDAWDQDTFERSLSCLTERRLAFESLVHELAVADAAVAQKAVLAAASLPQVEPCRDRDLLLRLPAPPPEQRDEIDRVRAELARAQALEDAGKYAEGLAVTDATLASADAVGWAPLGAGARTRRGSLLERTGEYAAAESVLEEAYFMAAKAGAHGVAADAGALLVVVVGSELSRPAEGRRWARNMELSLAALGEEDALRTALHLTSLAGVEQLAGDYAAAVDLYAHALAIRERFLEPDHPAIASTLNNLGVVRADQGSYDAARDLYERALAMKERALGREHPDVAGTLTNLATILDAKGDLAAARELNLRALAILEATFGPHHPRVARVVGNLAGVYLGIGDYPAAHGHYERCLAIFERALGPDHPNVAIALDNLGMLELRMGRPERALPLHERALAITEKAYGPDHLDVAAALTSVGNARRAQGDVAAARTLHERAYAIREQQLGPTHPDLAISLNNLADIDEAHGDHEGAQTRYQRALAIKENALGRDNAALCYSLEGLAVVALAQHRAAEAVALLERSLAIRGRGSATDGLARARDLLERARTEARSASE